MKTVPAALTTALRSSYNLQAVPRLTVEWNLNRNFAVTADNVLPETRYGYNPEYFPISSITSPNRPTKGVVKGRADSMVLPGDDPSKQDARYYLADKDDYYKYWSSPDTTDVNGNFPIFDAAYATSRNFTGDAAVDGLTVVRPYITYASPVKANKIVIKVENSWASPNSYNVLIRTTVGGAWTSIATTGLVDATGQLTLYWNGSTWTGTKPTGSLVTTNIAGIMFRVNSMTSGRDLSGNKTTYMKGGTQYTTDGKNSFFELIEIAACLEADLSKNLISVSDTQDMSEASLVYPIGTITANSGSLTLSNIYTDAEYGLGTSTDFKPGLFSDSNTASPFYGLSKQNTTVNLEYLYTVNGTVYPVQQFKMYSGSWNSTDEAEIEVPMQDRFKFFDEDNTPPLFWMGRTVVEIVWRICDQMGYVDYDVNLDAIDSQPVVPFFWTDGTETVMEVFDKLANATQTAIYCDSWGRLQIRSRRHAFNTASAPVWTLRGKQNGTELTDIIGASQNAVEETNNVNVKYYATDLTPWNNGIPTLTPVWAPDDTVLLRASVLANDLLTTGTKVGLRQKDAEIWPFTGIIQVEGEIIRYEGKEMIYFTYTETNTTDGAGNVTTSYTAPVRHVAVCNSVEDYNKYNEMTPYVYRYQNHYNGNLIITKRGEWNSEVKDHFVKTSGYDVRKFVGGVLRSGTKGLSQDSANSQVRMSSTFKSSTDMMLATRGSSNGATYYAYGLRLKFSGDAKTDQRAGLVINSSGTSEKGYFMELQLSENVKEDKRREMLFYTRAPAETRIGGKDNKGRSVSVAAETWYDIDCTCQVDGSGNHVIRVMVNGKTAFDLTIAAANTIPLGGRFGMFVRGTTQADFEYLYAITNQPVSPPDETTFWDAVNGGYLGSQWDTEFNFNWAGMDSVLTDSEKARKRLGSTFMDEFGPWAHEIREYDVVFDPSPVTTSKLIQSAPEVYVPSYRSGSFGAQFRIFNKARRNIVVHGEDSTTFAGTGDTVDQVLTILGRNLVIQEAQQVTRSNDAQIKVNGKITTEIDSPFIQSESAATEIADWINEHWSTGADNQDVTVFGNPLFEIGDVVAVDYPDKFMAASTHKYFVMGISTNFESGLETSLTLRRVT